MVKKCPTQLFKQRGEQQLVIQMQTALNSEDNCPACVQIYSLAHPLTIFENSG